MSARTLVAAAAAFAILLLGAASAPATTVVRTHPGNQIVPAGATLTGGDNGGRAIAVLTSLGTISCGAYSDGTLAQPDGNPAVTGTLNSFILAPCSDSFPVINITSCTAVPPFPHITVTATGTGGTNTLTNLYKRCTIAGSPTSACYYYAATATALFTNVNATLTYANVAMQHTVPPGGTGDLGALCGTTGSFSADFPDIHTTGGRTLTVTTS